MLSASKELNVEKLCAGANCDAEENCVAEECPVQLERGCTEAPVWPQYRPFPQLAEATPARDKAAVVAATVFKNRECITHLINSIARQTALHKTTLAIRVPRIRIDSRYTRIHIGPVLKKPYLYN